MCQKTYCGSIVDQLCVSVKEHVSKRVRQSTVVMSNAKTSDRLTMTNRTPERQTGTTHRYAYQVHLLNNNYCV